MGGASSAIGSGALPSTHETRRENDETVVRRVAPDVRGRFAAAMIVSMRELLDRRAAAGRPVERSVHVAVLRFGSAAKRLGVGEIADDRMRATRRRRAAAFSLSRTSAVTVWPPRRSASSTAAPT